MPQRIMGAAGSSMSRDARKQNKKIETTLRKDKLDQINIIKLLLLGTYNLQAYTSRSWFLNCIKLKLHVRPTTVPTVSP